MGTCYGQPHCHSAGALIGEQFIVGRHENIKDHYDIAESKLGEGAFGSVHRAEHKATGAVRAVKKLGKTTRDTCVKTKHEIELMRRIDHPSIIKLFETFEDEHHIYLAMELCTGGDLYQRTKAKTRFTEAETAILMRQVLRSVHYLHERSICHRDVKLENFLFTSNEDVTKASLKMIDFGLACFCEEGDVMREKVGTPMYVAPEVLNGRYRRNCDEWSCGVLLFILLSGTPPFKGKSKKETMEKVRDCKFEFKSSSWKTISQGAKDLIRKLLDPVQSRRCTTEQAFNDVWMRCAAPVTVSPPPASLADSFEAFGSRNKLAQAALLVSARQLGSDAELEPIARAFAALDGNGDGMVSQQELKEGFRRHRLEVAQDLDAKALVEAVDQNRNGMIEYTEFLAANLDRKFYLQEDILQRSFQVFDLDGDGGISKKELQQLLKISNDDQRDINREIGDIFLEVDKNCDGSIDFKEYVAMLEVLKAPTKRPGATYRSPQLF